MKKYSFKIQFNAIGDEPAQVLQECTFIAPDFEVAGKYADEVLNLFGSFFKMPSFRAYERTTIVEVE